MARLSGWGRYPICESNRVHIGSTRALDGLLRSESGVIARGRGRAYGDAAIGERISAETCGLDRMVAFDPATGTITAEAGVALDDLLRAFIPRGYFPPVVPGTKFVTLGGMVAADVHGKNHHRDGGFGQYVDELHLRTADGQSLVCSHTTNPDVFAATIGGMGLTGIITRVTFRMKPIETGWLRQHSIAANNLRDLIGALEGSSSATYSVAWIDCLAKGLSLGRGLVFTAEHLTRAELEVSGKSREQFPAARSGKLSVPFDLPGRMLNRHSVGAFNALYFSAGARKAGTAMIVPWDSYFFPLDGIAEWNRLYGKRGFVQYQCVIPRAASEAALTEIVGALASSGQSSFLAVLKQLGAGSGTISFPMPGYTLAVDLPVTSELFPLLDQLDRTLVRAGGRIYLAKDSRQSRETLEAGYEGLPAFRSLRQGVGARGAFESHLSRRLAL